MISYIYKVHHVPASDGILLPFFAGKLACLRLSALTLSAAAFSSTFEMESAFTAPQWIRRLQRPSIHTFVVVAYGAGTPPARQTIDAGDWIGSATLLGPLPKAKFELPESSGPVIGSDEEETRWQMTAVYNSPSHRGKGIAKMLIQGALDFASEQSGPNRHTRVRIIIHPDNVVVKKLYLGLEFADAGNATVAEAFLVNGDSELMPADGGASQLEKYHRRAGLVMERFSAPVC